MKFKAISFGLASAVVLSTVVGVSGAQAANLVENGGFEAPDIPSGSFGLFNPDIPGWALAAGSNIELQDNVAGAPYEGSQFLELDSTSVSAVSQILDTIAGQTYKLQFAFSPRPNVSNNLTNVRWNGGILDTISKASTSSQTQWEVFSYFVQATSNQTELRFDNLLETSNTVGSYIDDVSVVAVPTPALIPGLIGLGAAAWRKRKQGAAQEA